MTLPPGCTWPQDEFMLHFIAIPPKAIWKIKIIENHKLSRLLQTHWRRGLCRTAEWYQDLLVSWRSLAEVQGHPRESKHWRLGRGDYHGKGGWAAASQFLLLWVPLPSNTSTHSSGAIVFQGDSCDLGSQSWMTYEAETHIHHPPIFHPLSIHLHAWMSTSPHLQATGWIGGSSMPEMYWSFYIFIIFTAPPAGRLNTAEHSEWLSSCNQLYTLLIALGHFDRTLTVVGVVWCARLERQPWLISRSIWTGALFISLRPGGDQVWCHKIHKMS
jgi:hypothetical protein